MYPCIYLSAILKDVKELTTWNVINVHYPCTTFISLYWQFKKWVSINSQPSSGGET